MFAKWLWDELSAEEFQLFINLPGVISIPEVFVALKLRANQISKKEIREFLMNWRNHLALGYVLDRQQYLSLKGQLKIFIIDEEFTLRKSAKYSGYTRHFKDKGTLKKEHPEFSFEKAEPFLNVKIKEELIMEVWEYSVSGITPFGFTIRLNDGANKHRNGNNKHKKL
jgi:hypothetical protein